MKNPILKIKREYELTFTEKQLSLFYLYLEENQDTIPSELFEIYEAIKPIYDLRKKRNESVLDQ